MPRTCVGKFAYKCLARREPWGLESFMEYETTLDCKSLNLTYIILIYLMDDDELVINEDISPSRMGN